MKMKPSNAVIVSALLIWLAGVLGGVGVTNDAYWLLYLSFIPSFLGGTIAVRVSEYLASREAA